MLSFYGIISSCVVLCFIGSVQGYWIDPTSCGTDTAFVKELVEQAFTMATVTSAAIKATPLDGYTTFLIQNLFNPGTGNALEEIEKVFDIKTTEEGTTGILSIQQQWVGEASSLPINEVAIFCNEDRLTPINGNVADDFDTVMKVLIPKNNFCRDNFMYTETFDLATDTIQICSWFLNYAKVKKYRTISDLRSFRAALAVMGMDKLLTKVLYTPIDLLSLWDKCMLHEMMHTKAGGDKSDIGLAQGYGWKNCKKLSTNPECYDNADSFAILGSALYWNSQGNQIDVDGKFTTPPQRPKRWLGSGAGRGLDNIRLDAVKQFV